MKLEHATIAVIVRTIRSVIDWLSRLALLIAPLVLRIALAVPFFRSGLTKWDGFLSLTPSAIFLFQQDFKLHIFGGAYDFPAPALFAFLSSTAEITLPILLVIGLATRFAALGLLVMTGIIQLVVPEAWANFHLPWAAMAVAIIALGPGRLSLDSLLESYLRASRHSKPPT